MFELLWRLCTHWQQDLVHRYHDIQQQNPANDCKLRLHHRAQSCEPLGLGRPRHSTDTR
jgi:hypothetical protein